MSTVDQSLAETQTIPTEDLLRPSDEFLGRVKQELAALRESEATIATSPTRESAATAPVDQTASAYRQAAAVLAWFEPDKLRPLNAAASPQHLDALIEDCATVFDKNHTPRLSLLPEPRIAALRELRQSGLIEKALNANERPDDPIQTALDACLLGKAAPLEAQTLEQLAATYLATTWLRAAGFEALPAPEAIARRTDRLRLLQPFEHLASDDQFRGRVSELQQLRTYAGVLPPGSLIESARRTLETIFDWSKKPPLLISGPGGVGKSALVARFILEHARAHKQDRFPFVYLDFDRPEVDSAEPLTLLIEAVRQLGAEYPERARAANVCVTGGSSRSQSRARRSRWKARRCKAARPPPRR